jgi:hypothetical protein
MTSQNPLVDAVNKLSEVVTQLKSDNASQKYHKSVQDSVTFLQ